jgi:ketosteroid isomerase-like protein/mono/diheme cytochrome c family protein
MKTLIITFAAAVLALAAGAAFVHFGLFDISADTPHSRPVHWLVETVRERSIAMRSRNIQVPPLDDPALIAQGASDYSAMCTGCHLAPGMDQDSEMRAGLYPQPPNLSKPSDLSPAEMFWTIKHGVKMTAMPAWGKTHDDPRMWAMVALIQKLPDMSLQQYQALADAGGGHSHAHGSGSEAMPGMNMKSGGDAHAGHDHSGAADAMPGMDMRPKKSSTSSDTPEAAVEGFLKALAAGDAKTAEHWLAPDVLIYESGGVESSRDEYVAHHMKADMEFLAKAKTERLENAANGSPWIAWVTSRSRVTGKSDGKVVDLFSTETMVLKREDQGWRIAHIHWSSQKAGAEQRD